MTTPTPAEAFAARRDLYLVERLRRTYNGWNNPPSDGLPDGADVLLDAADTIERLVKECEGVVALTPPAVPEGWQPIETAPKDDNYIRVWSWGRERHAKWNDDRYSKRPRPFWDMDGMSVSRCRAQQPTFWMPTAAAPSAPEGK